MSEIKNLNFSWNKKPLLNIEYWELPDTGITSIMGPSGCGKSSLIRCLLGLELCSGEWILRGKNVLSLAVNERNFSVVFQSLELFPHMTAQENILFAANNKKTLTGVEASLKELVEALGLEACIDRKASQLSGGEAQRVAVARALIVEPEFLFLDEPFSSLDEDNKEQARQLIKKVIKSKKIPTLLITHDQRDVEALADHSYKIVNRTILAFHRE